MFPLGFQTAVKKAPWLCFLGLEVVYVVVCPSGYILNYDVLWLLGLDVVCVVVCPSGYILDCDVLHIA